MKTLIISDTHLSKFDKKKFDYLRNLFQKYDQIILNGDFYDNWFINYEEFLKSQWSELFPILREKETVYIFGNHDPKPSNIKSINGEFYESACYRHVFTIGEVTKVQVEHGDRFIFQPKNSELNFLQKIIKTFLLFVYSNMPQALLKFIRGIFQYIERLIFIIFRDKIKGSVIGLSKNEIMKKYIPENIDLLICGDSHSPEIDYEKHYINSGFVMYGYSNYLEINDGKLNLVNEKY